MVADYFPVAIGTAAAAAATVLSGCSMLQHSICDYEGGSSAAVHEVILTITDTIMMAWRGSGVTELCL